MSSSRVLLIQSKQAGKTLKEREGFGTMVYSRPLICGTECIIRSCGGRYDVVTDTLRLT